MAAAAPAQAAVVPAPAPAPAPQSSAVATVAAPSKEAEKKVMEVDKKRLFVRWEVTDESLKAVFEQFGKVTETRVVRGPRLRAFGFLTFDSEEAAAKAKDAMSGKSLSAGPLSIEFASAAGAARAREKKERIPKQPKPAPAAGSGPGPAPASNAAVAKPAGNAGTASGRGAGRRGVGRASNANTNAQPAANQSAAAPASGGRARRRRGRGRGAGVPANSGSGTGPSGVSGNAPATGENKQRESRYNDPNWGKVVRLVPDPILNPLPKDAPISEVLAGERQFKAGRTSNEAKQIASLVLNADPTKGPFNCDFKLGNFALRLLEVKVASTPGDTRVSCRVEHPDSGRNREVYLRVKTGEPTKNKYLELPTNNKDETVAEVETFFVTVDSIQLDVNTGFWKKIMLSLMSLMLPRRPPQQQQPR